MNFDLDTNNYTKDDYMDIFNLDKSMNPSKDTVEKNAFPWTRLATPP